jgi:hypothetical protein
MLHKDYDRKGSVAKKYPSGREPQGAWLRDELIGGKLPNSDSEVLEFVHEIGILFH